MNILRESNISASPLPFDKRLGRPAHAHATAIVRYCSAALAHSFASAARSLSQDGCPAFRRWSHDTARMGTWYHAAALFSRATDVVCHSHMYVSWFVFASQPEIKEKRQKTKAVAAFEKVKGRAVRRMRACAPAKTFDSLPPFLAKMTTCFETNWH